MKLLSKLRAAIRRGLSRPEKKHESLDSSAGQFVDKPKDYPDGLPKNHTEHIDSLGVQPGSKV